MRSGGRASLGALCSRRFLPAKAIDVIEEAAARVALTPLPARLRCGTRCVV